MMQRVLTDGLKAVLKHSPVFPLLRKRHFHAYAVGGPKTGTLSLGRMFRASYRSAHEPLGARTMEYVLAAHRGSVGRDDLMKYLRWRDRELYLDMESSHFVAIFGGVLAEMFPRAKFVLAVREPRSWLDSIINQHRKYPLHEPHPAYHKPKMAFFRALHDLYYKYGQYKYSPGERVLEKHGLYTLDGYLSAWAEHNRLVLASIPSERLLVLRTELLSMEIERLAQFLEIPLHTIDLEQTHAHVAPKRYRLLDEIDPDLLDHKIHTHCRPVLDLLAEVAPDQWSAPGTFVGG